MSRADGDFSLICFLGTPSHPEKGDFLDQQPQNRMLSKATFRRSQAYVWLPGVWLVTMNVTEQKIRVFQVMETYGKIREMTGRRKSSAFIY